jgi:hypothetical protein
MEEQENHQLRQPLIGFDSGTSAMLLVNWRKLWAKTEEIKCVEMRCNIVLIVYLNFKLINFYILNI